MNELSGKSNDGRVPSPYKRDLEPTPEDLRPFFVKAGAALSPGFSEMISEETRKAQQKLLIVAALLLLIALGALRFDGKLDFAGFKFDVEAGGVFLEIGLVVCVYLELLVAVRFFTDWNAWRIKIISAELDLQSIEEEFRTFSFEPREYLEALGLARYEYYKTQKGKEHIPFEDSEARISKARIDAKNDARIAAFRRKSVWFRRRFSYFRWSRNARFLIEILFPLAFGAMAIAYGFGAIQAK
jgi:hypothetical protein